MTYLFSSNVEVSNDSGNPLPISGNIGVLNAGELVTLLNPLPVTLGSANVTIFGNTNIIDTVTVLSTPENPVHVHLTEIGTSGNLLATGIDYMPISGNVAITSGNLAIFGNISGITNLPPVSIVGNVNVNPITGNVSIHGNVGIDGNISGITNLPQLTISSGNLAIFGNISGITGNVNVNSVTVTGITSNINVNSYSLIGITNNVNVVVQGNISGITTLPAISLASNVNVNPITGNVGITGNVNVNPLSVTVTSIPEVEIKNDSGNPVPISGNINATLTGTPVVSFGGVNLDAFGRLRVSNPVTLFDSALSGERRYDWSSATATGGTVTFDYNANVRNLNVTAASGSEVIRESIWCFPYQPGKSLLIMTSFYMSPSKTGLRQRVGYFGAANGVYFEQTNGIKNMVIRSSSSGVLVEDRYAQSTWNTDKLDGTGPSGLTLDTTATQIFWCDVEWLGVGSVRTGFIINGQLIICHIFHHANNPTYTTTYMGSATLPCRYEITNIGVTSGSSTMKQICTTIMSEGGYISVTQVFSAGTGITPRRLTTAATYYPIASIRLNSTHLNSIVKLHQVDILSPTINYYRWVVLKNATLTGATWNSAFSTVRVDVDTAATAVSGGTEMESGYIASRELASLSLVNIYGQLSRTLAGVSDTFTLAMAATSNNADVLAQIGWQEIT